MLADVHPEQGEGFAFARFRQETADASLRPGMTGIPFHQPVC
jgi:hypothetical protein